MVEAKVTAGAEEASHREEHDREEQARDERVARKVELDDERANERKVARIISFGLPVATLSASLTCGVIFGVPMAILVLAAGVLLGVIALFWASLRVLSGEVELSPELASLEAARHGVDALASRKKMLLRALKDLDNERALGKLDDDDYTQISQTYRDELKELLRKIDASLAPHRAKADEAVRLHLEKVGLLGTAGATSGAKADASGKVSKATAAGTKDESVRVECPACKASNEPDAKFCKGCGGGLGAAARVKDAVKVDADEPAAKAGDGATNAAGRSDESSDDSDSDAADDETEGLPEERSK